MGKRKTQRYWVETQAQDGSWSPAARAKDGYVTHIRPVLMRDADAEVAFAERVAEYAVLIGVQITGIRVMQVDPNGRKNLYKTVQVNQPVAEGER